MVVLVIVYIFISFLPNLPLVPFWFLVDLRFFNLILLFIIGKGDVAKFVRRNPELCFETMRSFKMECNFS